MTIHASFAKELARLWNCDDRFLALLRHDRKLDLAPLNVKNRVGDVALLEDMLIFMEFQYLLPRAHFGEKYSGVKHVLVWLLHGSLLWLDQFQPILAYRTATVLVISRTTLIPDRAIAWRHTKASTEVAGRALALRRAWRKS